jgi:hypothetical protein
MVAMLYMVGQSEGEEGKKGRREEGKKGRECLI